MLGALFSPEVVTFTAALVLMGLIGLLEAVGLGIAGLDLDFGVGLDDGGMLGWLGFGRVPLLVLLIAFLASFGILGFAIQQVAQSVSGAMLPIWGATPLAAVLSLPVTKILARGLGRIMPHDQTTAYPLEGLVGLAASITIGRAVHGSPARARVIDPHGQAHHVMVEPDDGTVVFNEGDTVLLVRREKDVFRAISHGAPPFSNWIQ